MHLDETMNFMANRPLVCHEVASPPHSRDQSLVPPDSDLNDLLNEGVYPPTSPLARA